MKKLVFLMLWFWIMSGLSATPLPRGEEIEFCFEPSFSDGTMIWLARTSGGKIQCSVYTLPVAVDGRTESHSKARPKLLKEVAVSAMDFDALVREIEAQGLRTEAETSDPVGIDGTSWMFRHSFGGRALELRFWSPEIRKGSGAYALGAKIAAVAQIKGALPEESQDPHGDIPAIVPDVDFKEPNQGAEPTRTAVTPPASASAKASADRGAGDRASGARGSP